jgi:threonyl-tRNA synthetase
MAEAVLEIFPQARLAIGPPIADGFYYDFDLPRSLTDEDLEDISKRMKKIVSSAKPFEHSEMSKDEARSLFAQGEQSYKLELIDGIEGDTVSIYKQSGFTDLCAGPHVRNTKECKHFKLLSVAGAYWRGDAERPMLQRIYGTVWPTREELDAYVEIREEAKRRDHRKLGKELELFFSHPFSPGAAFWQPNGVILYDQLVAYWRELMGDYGYVEIRNPIVYDSELYAVSGHLDHYRENMFTLEVEGRLMCVKPMNCPDTMLFYNTRKRSYRELPLRVAETQILHRNELSGALSGLTRVRQFTQDDAHIFVMPEQIEGEIASLLSLVDEVYSKFSMECRFYLATRPADYMGELALWEQAETALANALDASGKAYKVNPGDGTFYGPKIDIYVRDSLGRQFQCATIQLDFQLPERFELEYVGADNEMHRPVVIHRAIFGSFERFIGVLLEHLAGAFPTWLAPVQAIFLPINDRCTSYCQTLRDAWRKQGVRAKVDDRQEKVGYKIRQAEMAKVPYMLVVGPKEIETGQVNLRTYKDGERGAVEASAVLEELLAHSRSRELDVPLHKLDLDRFIDPEDLDADVRDY